MLKLYKFLQKFTKFQKLLEFNPKLARFYISLY